MMMMMIMSVVASCVLPTRYARCGSWLTFTGTCDLSMVSMDVGWVKMFVSPAKCSCPCDL